MNLQLAVKGEYFDAMKRGEKAEEYRLYNEYWRNRLITEAWKDFPRQYEPDYHQRLSAQRRY